MDEKKTQNENARILIGREEEVGSLSDIFALCIVNKMIYSFKASERDEQDYISNCKNAAEDIAQQMIKKRLEGYCIENGKRQYLRGIVPCKAIPTDGIKVFTNTLAAKLSHAKVIV